MWNDIVSGFAAAPVWAQVVMVVFAILFITMATAPARRRREFSRKFDALGQGLGVPVRRGQAPWPATLALTLDGRPFEVVHDYRSRQIGTSYRGPVGHLLFYRTTLGGTRWELHGVEINPRLVASGGAGEPVASGDAAFDRRFVVRQDGVPVRAGWLDLPTSHAIGTFYDVSNADGPTWVTEGRLEHVVPPPWEYVAPTTVRPQLRVLAALAAALERTAGVRAPQA